VVSAIVLLGGSLGKAVVAEGIETAAQREQLREMGCRFGQG
jgi:EAL domain-containing protein (putative c-di-GMP-specific phosphodiesterase class I)